MLLTSKIDTSNSVSRAIDIAKIYNSNHGIYINKADSDLVKDRIAAAVLDAISYTYNHFYKTAIIAIGVDSREEAWFESDRELPYASLISLIYQLRMDQHTVKSLVNYTNGADPTFVSLEELHTDTDTLRIVLDDRILPVLDTLIQDKSELTTELHRGVSISIESSEDTGDKLIKTFGDIYGYESVYTVYKNRERAYTILEGEITGVIHNNSALLVSTKNPIDSTRFILRLTQRCFSIAGSCTITKSNEVYMF